MNGLMGVIARLFAFIALVSFDANAESNLKHIPYWMAISSTASIAVAGEHHRNNFGKTETSEKFNRHLNHTTFTAIEVTDEEKARFLKERQTKALKASNTTAHSWKTISQEFDGKLLINGSTQVVDSLEKYKAITPPVMALIVKSNAQAKYSKLREKYRHEEGVSSLPSWTNVIAKKTAKSSQLASLDDLSEMFLAENKYCGDSKSQDQLMLSQLDSWRTHRENYDNFIYLEANKLVAAGDVEQLYQASMRIPFTAHERKCFFVQRHERWIQILSEQAKRHKHMTVVVGAAHLGGPDGILNMLRKMGFEILKGK